LAQGVAPGDEKNDHRDHKQQSGVGNQLIHRRDHEKEDGAQFQNHIGYAYPGVKRHFFMGNDAGIIGGLDDVHAGDQDGELENPVDCAQAFGRDDQAGVQEPQAGRLGKDDNGKGHHQVKRHAHIKDTLEGGFVPASQLHAHEALGGCVQGGLQEGEQGDDASDYAIKGKIVHTQDVQDYARGVKGDGQAYQHAHIKGSRVFGYASFVLKFCHILCFCVRFLRHPARYLCIQSLAP